MACIWTNKWPGKRIDVQTVLLQIQTGLPLALDMGKGAHESERWLSQWAPHLAVHPCLMRIPEPYFPSRISPQMVPGNPYD